MPRNASVWSSMESPKEVKVRVVVNVFNELSCKVCAKQNQEELGYGAYRGCDAQSPLPNAEVAFVPRL